MNTSISCLMAASLALLASPSFAVLVIDYDSDTNGASIRLENPTIDTGDFDGEADASDNIYTYAFQQRLETGVDGYLGPDAYIGAEGGAFDSTRTNFSNRNVSTTINFRQQVTGTGEQGGTMHIAVIFRSDVDFAFGATSSVLIDQNRAERTGQRRWLAMDADGDIFVSDVGLGAGSNPDFAALSAIMWASYDPAAAINVDLDSLTYGTSTAGLGLLSGFGFYTDQDDIQNGRIWSETREFKVDADAIPEPSMVALLLGGASAMFLVLRRRS